ncbi:MAG: c-type cytochrome biogenesis protein CcmI [Gammaproteobacteria bacterium]|nr:MAG: c-type cytochrome biogenesis protein CcmI [Gammaproteobacteria bacterium]
MMIFWGAVAAMVLLALAFILPPLLGRGRESAMARETLNAAIYRARLRELEMDRENGQLSPERFDEAKKELAREFLMDTEAAPTPPPAPTGRGRWVAAAVALFIPLMAVGLYWQWGGWELIGAKQPQASDIQQQQLAIEQMVARLAKRLEEQPDDPKGWLMLGKSYMVMERYEEAARAYEKAYELIGDDPDLLADYAEALAFVQGDRLAGKPEALLKKALEKDPHHPKALWLSGIAAFQEGRFEEAIERWRALLSLLPPESRDAQVVRQLLARAEGHVEEVQDKASEPAEKAAIEVEVTLDPKLAERVEPDDTLFVFARAAEGPRVPLAVVRKKASDLPLHVTLDDSMAMVPSLRLSRFPKVMVEAHISKSGQAVPQSGDIKGRVGPIEVRGLTSVQVTLDQVVP